MDPKDKLTEKELEKFLWEKVMSRSSGFVPTLDSWDPLYNLEHAMMMAEPMRRGDVDGFPMYFTFGDEGGATWRATVHAQYDFEPIASALDERNPAMAVCMAVRKAFDVFEGRGKWECEERPRFWQMWRKPPTPKVGVGVVIRKMEPKYKEMVLLGLRKGAHGEGQWSLPGGHMELGESFLDVCRREVKEETGLDVREVEPLGFTNDVFEEDGLHYVTLFFDAIWDGRQEPRNLEPDKCESLEWKDVHDLPKNLFPPLRRALETNAVGGMLDELL